MIPQKIKDILLTMVANYGVTEFSDVTIDSTADVIPNCHYDSVPKRCYDNAFTFVAARPNMPGLAYSVGYLLIPSIAIPIEHAVIRRGDKYCDPTLDETQNKFVPIFEITNETLVRYVSEHEFPDITVPQIYDIHRLIRQGILTREEVTVK